MAAAIEKLTILALPQMKLVILLCVIFILRPVVQPAAVLTPVTLQIAELRLFPGVEHPVMLLPVVLLLPQTVVREVILLPVMREPINTIMITPVPQYFVLITTILRLVPAV